MVASTECGSEREYMSKTNLTDIKNAIGNFSRQARQKRSALGILEISTDKKNVILILFSTNIFIGCRSKFLLAPG